MSEKPVQKSRNGTFRIAVNTIVRSIPEYKSDPKSKINETIHFRNQMILEMCRGVHDSFNGRMSMKPSSVAKNIYSAAVDIALLVLAEELSQEEKLNIREEFDS
jgi:hypothetical protein